MERKIKVGMTPANICAIVFGSLGIIYFLLGIGLTQFPTDAEDYSVGIVFTALGGCFLAVTLILLGWAIHHRRHLQKIFAAGKYIWGEITEITANYNVRVNNRHPYTLLVRYQDRYGNIHIFRSGNLKAYPDRSIIGKQVKVYYEDERFNHYYIDLEGVLPTVIEH